MDNNLNFYTAYSHLYDVYGVEINEDLFETLGMLAWNKIGNKQSRIYKVQLVPESDMYGGWYIELPCNVDTVEAVTANYEDYQKTSSTQNFPGIMSLSSENHIEFEKYGTNDLYMSGKFLQYRQTGDRLYFTEPYNVINLLYKGVYADEEGLPFLNIKEVDAIAIYCSYTSTMKKARATQDNSTLQMAMADKQLWDKACSAARVPQSISQNEMNQVLDANVSWNRKMYGKSYKSIQ